MDATRDRVEEVFCAALDLRDPAERAAYVEQACAGDTALGRAVEELLSKQGDVEDFFGNGSPAVGVAVELAKTLPPQADIGKPARQEALMDAEVGSRVGPYKLLQKIGEGGCGTVYMAEQEFPVRRRVALKIIKLGMDTKSVIARFEAERQALAMMDHPNIARVLDAGATETGRPYFVMELVRGVRITTYCDEKRLDTTQRLALFTQVCHALQHAHQKGIIHRDIKPSNILVTSNDHEPVPKVIDFGIAKATGGQLLTDKTIFTAYEQFVGTPAYMSPEQAEWSELDVDTRSDIYSLGVLLYELLTGKTPFDQKELLQAGIDSMRRTLRERDPHRPSTKLDGMREEELTQTALQRQAEPARLKSLLSGDLDWIVMKALEKDRTRRYQTANGLASDVLRLLNHEPVIARPPSRWYRLKKLVRRNRIVFAAGTAVVLALVVGLGAATYMFVRERQARQIASRALANEARLRHEAEAQSKITQAAILISRDRFQEANDLVEGMDLPVLKPSLEAAGVFRRLTDWGVTEGRWSAAAHHLLKLVQANQIDKTDMTDAATRELLKVGPALLLTGDTNGYRQFIRETLARFAETTNPVAAEQLLKASTIIPIDAGTIRSLMPLATIVEDSMRDHIPSGGWENYMFAWRAFALSRFAYRRGNYKNAITWAQRSQAYQEVRPTCLVMSHAILALAYWQRGDIPAAQAELATARQMIEQARTPNYFDAGIALGKENTGFWHDWIEVRLLLNEAALAIEGVAPPPFFAPRLGGDLPTFQGGQTERKQGD